MATMTASRDLPGQLHIVDKAQYLLQPTPVSVQDAWTFLRSPKNDLDFKVKTTLQLRSDHDRLTVKIEADDTDANKGHYFQECELPIAENDPDRQRRIIDMARRAHQWLRTQVFGMQSKDE